VNFRSLFILGVGTVWSYLAERSLSKLVVLLLLLLLALDD
jgi:hypothetical protein